MHWYVGTQRMLEASWTYIYINCQQDTCWLLQGLHSETKHNIVDQFYLPSILYCHPRDKLSLAYQVAKENYNRSFIIMHYQQSVLHWYVENIDAAWDTVEFGLISKLSQYTGNKTQYGWINFVISQVSQQNPRNIIKVLWCSGSDNHLHHSRSANCYLS